jgi:hypothetical protein
VKARILLAAVAVMVLGVLLALVLRRNSGKRQQNAATMVEQVQPPPPPPVPTTTNNSLINTPTKGRAFNEFNRFVTLVKPYGLDGPIDEGDVTFVREEAKGRLLMETKTHLADFVPRDGRSGPVIHHFLATQDMSNPVASPEGKNEARSKWYQATAKWTAEEALAETQRLMQTLGIGGVAWQSTNVEPFTIDVKNPQGQSVTVTPFYTVTLKAPHHTLTAEFRMGQSGPGRLTEWYVWPPLPK